MRESTIHKQIMLAAPRHRCRLFRNNVGMLPDRYGQMVRYGLAVGSSDLIGWYSTSTSTAVFLAVEVKRPGEKPTTEQSRFLEAVRAAGGIAILATSVEDFVRGIDAYELVPG